MVIDSVAVGRVCTDLRRRETRTGSGKLRISDDVWIGHESFPTDTELSHDASVLVLHGNFLGGLNRGSSTPKRR
jgi:hypothetical protein